MQASFVVVIHLWEGAYYGDCPDAGVFGVNEFSLTRLEERLPREIEEKVLWDLVEGRAIRTPAQLEIDDSCFVKLFTVTIELPGRSIYKPCSKM